MEKKIGKEWRVGEGDGSVLESLNIKLNYVKKKKKKFKFDMNAAFVFFFFNDAWAIRKVVGC